MHSERVWRERECMVLDESHAGPALRESLGAVRPAFPSIGTEYATSVYEHYEVPSVSLSKITKKST